MKINKEGYSIIITTSAVVVILMLVSLFLVPVAGMPLWVLWIIIPILLFFIFFTFWFFRKPNREYITNRDLVFAAADGKIVAIEEVEETEYLKERRIQVSIFMSVWNVHMNFFPVGGEVVFSKHHPGEFLVAWHPKSSTDNERTTIVVDNGKEKILFRQIAGFIARRIVNYAKVGDKAEQNKKFGFIKFGSRVDIFLPLDSEVLVSLDQKVQGGQTPIAKLKI